MFVVQNGERVSSLRVEHADEPALRLPPLGVDREPRRDLDDIDAVTAQRAGLDVHVTKLLRANPALDAWNARETGLILPPTMIVWTASGVPSGCTRSVLGRPVKRP